MAVPSHGSTVDPRDLYRCEYRHGPVSCRNCLGYSSCAVVGCDSHRGIHPPSGYLSARDELGPGVFATPFHRLSFSTRSRSLARFRVFVFVLSFSLFSRSGWFRSSLSLSPVAGFRVGRPCILQLISQVRLCVAQFSEAVGSASCSQKARALLRAVFGKTFQSPHRTVSFLNFALMAPEASKRDAPESVEPAPRNR